MKHALTIIFLLVSVSYGMLAHSKASTDLSVLDDETRSLIMKERMRTQGLNAGANQPNEGKNPNDPFGKKNTTVINGGISSGCDINIGNSKSRPGMNSKPTTVIITGPVIQMPGKGCK